MAPTVLDLEELNFKQNEIITYQLNITPLYETIQSLIHFAKKQQEKIVQLETTISICIERLDNHEKHVQRHVEKSVTAFVERIKKAERHNDENTNEIKALKKEVEKQTLQWNETHSKFEQQVNISFTNTTKEIAECNTRISTSKVELETLVAEKESIIHAKADKIREDLSKITNGFSDNLDAAEQKDKELRKRINQLFETQSLHHNMILFNEESIGKTNVTLNNCKVELEDQIEHVSTITQKKITQIEQDVHHTNGRINILYLVLQLDEASLKSLIYDLWNNDNIQKAKLMPYVYDCLSSETVLQVDSDLKPTDVNTGQNKHKQLGPGEAKIHADLHDLFAKSLLKTPAFRRLKDLLIDEISQSKQSITSNYDEYKRITDDRLIVVEGELLKKVGLQMVNQLIEDNEDVKFVKTNVQQNASDIEFLKLYYMSKQQAAESLKSKADKVMVELKADRKYVTDLFDFINQKLNTMLGQTSSEELMNAIKKIEGELIHQKEMIELVKPNNSASNSSIGSEKSKLNLANTGGGTKCLSCDRPFEVETNNAMPPSFVPSLTHSRIYTPSDGDPQKRMDLYKHWMNKSVEDFDALAPMNPNVPIDKSPTLGSGFKRPNSARGASNSPFFSELDDSNVTLPLISPRHASKLASSSFSLPKDLSAKSVQYPKPPTSAPSRTTLKLRPNSAPRENTVYSSGEEQDELAVSIETLRAVNESSTSSRPSSASTTKRSVQFAQNT